MALINGFGQAQWGVAPWGDPTGFNPTLVALSEKNVSSSVAVSEANTATARTAQVNASTSVIASEQNTAMTGTTQPNSSGGITIVTDGQN